MPPGEAEVRRLATPPADTWEEPQEPDVRTFPQLCSREKLLAGGARYTRSVRRFTPVASWPLGGRLAEHVAPIWNKQGLAGVGATH